MKVKRDLVVMHLQRITCGGQIPEAVFRGTFATHAMTADHQLLVAAPEMQTKAKLLKAGEAVGVSDLLGLMKALTVLAGEGNEAVNVDVKHVNHRLVIDEGERGLLSLMTAAPKTIATNLEPAVFEKVLETKAPKVDGKGILLTRQLVEGITSTFKLLKAVEIEMFVGPKGGKIRVGNENASSAEFASPDLKAKQEYSLLFGGHIIDVLSTLINYNEAMMYLGGPESAILVDDGGYHYLVMPHSKSADA